MKTSELIVELYEMNFVGRCDEDFPVLYVLNVKDNVIASVDILNFGVVDTTFKVFEWLKDYEKTRLLRLLFMYAITPLDERYDKDGY